MRKGLVRIGIKRNQIGISSDVEIGRDVINNVDFKNRKIGMIRTNYQRGSLGEGVVGEIDCRQLGIFRQIEAFELVVLKVHNLKIGAVAELNPVNVTAFAVKIVNERGITVNLDDTLGTNLAGDGCCHDFLAVLVEARGLDFILHRAVAAVHVEIVGGCGTEAEMERVCRPIGVVDVGLERDDRLVGRSRSGAHHHSSKSQRHFFHIEIFNWFILLRFCASASH